MPRGQAIRSPALSERSTYCFALIAFIVMSLLTLNRNSEIHATQQTQAKAWPDPLKPMASYGVFTLAKRFDDEGEVEEAEEEDIEFLEAREDSAEAFES